MTYYYRNIKGGVLDFSELDENYRYTEELFQLTKDASTSAVAASNYKGAWTGKTGAATMPASYSHLGKFWALAVAIPAYPGIQTKTPGTASEFVEIPLGSWTSLSGKPAVIAAGATAADARVAIGAAQSATTLAGYGITDRVSIHSEVPVALAGGAINCSLGNTFTETVSANRTLAFSNIPTGAYSCVLEINHTAGAITFPAGTVWAGTAPTLTGGKRHLFFFQRAQLGTAGWYVSALAGYST